MGFVILLLGLLLWRFIGFKYLLFSWIITLVMTLVLFSHSISTYNSKTSEYMARIKSGNHLNFKEKSSIYVLNLLISGFSYPIYPEVAKESFLLTFKSDSNFRVFEDDFFMSSEKIKLGFQNNKTRISWSGSEYNLEHPESRYALALNPCDLKIVDFDSFYEYSVKIRVEYPEKYSAVLLSYPFKIMIEEGLFNYLQKENWLHPYTAVWKTKVNK